MSLTTTRTNPCPVCGKRGCKYMPDRTAVMCMRVESSRRVGSWAWLHILKERPKDYKMIATPPPKREYISNSEAARIAREAFADLDVKARNDLARSLGLSYGTLQAFAVGWSREHQAYTFPMRRGVNGRICGIRLRSPDGHKWAVKGSRAGLFIPHGPMQLTLWICEGPTDTAALHQLGLCAVGRDSCTGGKADLEAFVNRIKPRVVVIVADPDAPGQRGAADLRDHLGRGVIVTPPAKDVREWVRGGATVKDLHDLLRKGVAA